MNSIVKLDHGRGIKIPSPGAMVGSYSNAAKRIPIIVKERKSNQLPDLSDAVAHRAFQESIPFTRIGSRDYGSLEPVVLERLHSNGMLVVSTQEQVLKFDDVWVKNAIREEIDHGIGAVLGTQHGISRVEIRSFSVSRSIRSLASKDVFFYIMLLAPAGLGLIQKKRWIDPIKRNPARSVSHI